MIALLTDPRVTIDPTRAAEVPATMVLALLDALDLRDQAEAEAMERARDAATRGGR